MNRLRRRRAAALLDTVERLMTRQGQLLEIVAIDELMARRTRLAGHMVTRRASRLADSYDRASQTPGQRRTRCRDAPAGRLLIFLSIVMLASCATATESTPEEGTLGRTLCSPNRTCRRCLSRGRPRAGCGKLSTLPRGNLREFAYARGDAPHGRSANRAGLRCDWATGESDRKWRRPRRRMPAHAG